MEFLPTTRHDTTLAVVTPKTQEIVQRYGDKNAFLARFVPAKLVDIYTALDKSVDAPKMVNVIKAYGDKQVAILLGLHIHKVMMYSGISEDKISDEGVKEIASNMVLSPAFRSLNIAFALSFFQEVMLGTYKLYSCRPIDFMNALQEYCVTANQRQRKLYEGRQERERAQAESERKAQAVSFGQFCESRGIDPATTPNPMDFAKALEAKARADAQAKRERQAQVQREMQKLVHEQQRKEYR